jgi:hypothetical protein
MGYRAIVNVNAGPSPWDTRSGQRCAYTDHTLRTKCGAFAPPWLATLCIGGGMASDTHVS